MNHAWESWCGAVLEQVRFWPDHKAIRRELLAHLEDGRADLERLGYARELAEQRTLEAMGDAVLVGSAMNRAHHPLLGWLWKVSRWLAVLLLTLAAYTAVFDIGFQDLISKTVSQFQMPEPPASAVELKLGRDTVWYDPEMIVDEVEDGYHIGVQVWIREGFPWHMDRFGPDTWLAELTGTDDQGNCGIHPYTMGEISLPGWNRRGYILYVRMDHVPQWLELRYPHGENNWAIRVEGGTAA